MLFLIWIFLKQQIPSWGKIKKLKEVYEVRKRETKWKNKNLIRQDTAGNVKIKSIFLITNQIGNLWNIYLYYSNKLPLLKW